MPYIDPNRMYQIEIEEDIPKTAGELNYVLTQVCLTYLGETPRYQQFNDVLGALEGCKLEMYRRKVAPYEDTKIEENGDVY